MPWTPKQQKFFGFVAGGGKPSGANASSKLSPEEAAKMLKEAKNKALSVGGK